MRELWIAVPRRPYDLVLVCLIVILAVLLSFIAPSEPVLWALAFAAVYFAPGYALVSALFPGRVPRLAGSLLVRQEEVPFPTLTLLERLALAIGLSITSAAIFGIILTRTIFEMTPTTVGIEFLVVTFAGSAVAVYRRSKLPPEAQFVLVFRVGSSGSKLSAPEMAVVLLIVSSLCVAGIMASGILGRSGSGEKYTEFYLTGTDGNMSSIQTSLKIGENGSVLVTVVNRVGASVEYNLTFGIYNGTHFNRYMKQNWTAEEQLDYGYGFYNTFSLKDGKTFQRLVTFSIGSAGSYKIHFNLDDGTEVKELWIFVEVASVP